MYTTSTEGPPESSEKSVSERQLSTIPQICAVTAKAIATSPSPSIQVNALHESVIQQIHPSNLRPSLDHFFRRFITVFLKIFHKQTS